MRFDGARFRTVVGGRGGARPRRVRHDGGVELAWVERGGPRVRPPAALGCGLGLGTGFVEHDRGGRRTLDFGGDGLVISIRIPAEAVRSGGPEVERAFDREAWRDDRSVSAGLIGDARGAPQRTPSTA